MCIETIVSPRKLKIKLTRCDVAVVCGKNPRSYFFSFLKFLFFFIAINHTTIFAQNTVVKGKVFDAETKEPLPFVNFLLKGTKVATTSDFDGNYFLSSPSSTDTLLVSYIGYKPVKKAIKRGQEQTINILLESNTINIEEVVINPGENPAHKLLRKVIANKYRNDRERATAYQYEVYNKIEFDLNNISKEMIESRALKKVKFIFDNIDSSDIEQKPYLPLFMTESLSEYYYRRNPKFKKEVIKGSKVAGLQDASVSQFMGEMYQQVNIYDNNILVFGKTFISPISDNGLFYYRYYIIDSTFIDGHKCYQVQFKPKRKQELTFKGNMWIADSLFAVKRLEMSIADDANINYVNALNVIQEYVPVDSTWMLSKDRLVIDFKMMEKKTGFYGRKTTSYRNHIINQPKDENFYSRTENIIVEDGAYKKTEEYWNDVRHDTLSANERKIYKMVDTIQSLPVYKTWIDIITIFATGYKVHGDFEYGPYYNTLSFNRIEGPRIRLGGRTSNAFSTWYELNGYVAYGVKDEKFKYRLGFKTYITKKPRQIVGITYKNDYEILGQSQNAFTQDNIMASLFRRNPLNNLTSVQEIKPHYELEYFTGFNTKLFFIHRTMTPLGGFTYNYSDSEGKTQYQKNIVTSEVKLLTRLAYDEKYIESTFSRASMGTKYPILSIEFTAGIKDFFQSHYNYQRVSINIEDRIRINPFGYTDYILEGGKIFGHVPYPLMVLHGGNETYVYDPYAFNMMNYYEFASDRYFTIAAFHHFEGFFLNKIPLLRKLKWREVVTAKYLVGSVFEKNRNVLEFPSTLNALRRGPYYEVSAGVENIFRIFRVDALWRLSYLDNPNIAKFGIRASLQVSF